MGFASYQGEKIISRQKTKVRGFVYYYIWGQEKKLLLVRVFQKKGLFFPKYYGDYEFFYEGRRLLRQVSKVNGLGTTEEISYQYDPRGRLIKKKYYNGAGALRYTASITYAASSQTPKKLNVIRMEEFPFFETDDSQVIQKLLDITGTDFDGTFHLLDLIDDAKEKTI